MNEPTPITDRFCFDLLNSVIKDVAFPTGSRHFGVFQKNSDYDYVIRLEDFEKHAGAIGSYKLDWVDYKECLSTDPMFLSVKLVYDRLVVNAIVVQSDAEYEVWTTMTILMKSLPVSLLQDKSKRVAIADALKELVRNGKIG